MPIRIKVHSDPSFVDATFLGVLQRGELGAVSRDLVAVARENKTHLLLFDCSAIEDGHTLVDLYEVAESLARDRSSPPIRESLIHPSLLSAPDAVRFWETTCRSRGLFVRVFNDRVDALAWLLETAEGQG